VVLARLKDVSDTRMATRQLVPLHHPLSGKVITL